ncbi:unnamed protein product [Leptosia nina]|uniref:Uncharacterized protein n=1 Tax=Leptosia nina TaxID=320188 RepID=A0AAV1J8U3_9NEOP
MYGLVVQLLVGQLVYQIQRAYGSQLNGEDLNQVINYLLKQKQYSDRHSHLHKSHQKDELEKSHNTWQSGKGKIGLGNAEATPADLDEEKLKSVLTQLYNHNGSSKKSNRHFHSKDSDVSNNPDGYSKVYLVLDPQAKIKAADVKRIGEIVTSLISDKSQLKQKARAGERRYKGFVLMDDFFARRRNRDSKEKFSKDSIERDYKPKRARSEYGGGSGRTAIPYIRHRGDIYEKE